jgi:hypothetical protein
LAKEERIGSNGLYADESSAGTYDGGARKPWDGKAVEQGIAREEQQCDRELREEQEEEAAVQV